MVTVVPEIGTTPTNTILNADANLDVSSLTEVEEIDNLARNAIDNATNSETTRSDANETPTAKPKPNSNPSNQERVSLFSLNRNSKHTAQRTKSQASKQTEKEKRKAQVQTIRDQSNAKAAKEKQRKDRQKAYEGRQTARDEKITGLGRSGGVTGLGILGAAVDGVFTYQAERAEDPDGSKALDLAKAGAVAGAWLVAEGAMWGITIAGMVKSGAGLLIDDAQENYDINKSIALHVNKDESGSNKGTLGGRMIDNEYAATSRQRQEQIMRNHKISTESVLGSEARQLHR